MDVSNTAEKIKSMEIRGAGKIARAAAEVLKEFSIQLAETNPEKFLVALSNAKDTLKATRPTAVSLENALTVIMSGAKGKDVEEMKKNIIAVADKFITNSNNAVTKIAELCAGKIPNDAVILTHCNSTVVVNCLIKAKNQGKNIKVFATETRPWGQGYITAQTLAEAGVNITLIVDSATRYFMDEIDLILFGADTITRDGSVINKIGTSQIAVCAYEHEKHIPVIICAESYKFSTKAQSANEVKIEERDPKEIIDPIKLKRVKIRNPVFDITPQKYIHSIITEFGEISPKNAQDIIKNLMSF
jgi:ribose 1,5-bisphosphate isomerase